MHTAKRDKGFRRQIIRREDVGDAGQWLAARPLEGEGLTPPLTSVWSHELYHSPPNDVVGVGVNIDSAKHEQT